MNVKLLTLFLLLCTSYQVSATLATYYVSAGNFDEDFADIASKHQDVFIMDNNKGIGVIGVQNYLRTLLDIHRTDDHVEPPSMCIEKEIDSTLFMDIDGEYETFHFSYLKFSDGAHQAFPSPTNNFNITIENGWHSTLLALYGTSGGIRSGLFIIIIDKDMALCDSECPPSQRYGPRSGDHSTDTANADEITLHSFPNPTFEQTQLTFQLKRAQKVNLQIISPSTGAVIAQKLSNYYLPEGNYQYDIDMQSLPAGMYLIVLKTNNQRQVIPIVKIE